MFWVLVPDAKYTEIESVAQKTFAMAQELQQVCFFLVLCMNRPC